MTSYSIAVVPGDGIGPEVVAESIKVLQAAAHRFKITFDFTEFEWGSDYYTKQGRMMPEDGLQALLPFDAIYFGAVGHPDIPDHVTLHGLLLPIRRSFNQSAHACRSSPVTVFPSSKRSRFSSSTFIEKGSRDTSPSFSAALASE